MPGSTPTILLDAGANAECQADWLLQFAQMGVVFARTRYAIERRRVGLLSIGEEASKGTPLVKETHALLEASDALKAAGGTFIGNVEGRDVMTPDVDVVVTDGFTGNVVLKTLEGGMRALVDAIFGAFATSPETQAASEVLVPALLPLYSTLDPDNTGGAMLLGVDGLCLISHGSSSATAIVNAIRVAKELRDAEIVVDDDEQAEPEEPAGVEGGVVGLEKRHEAPFAPQQRWFVEVSPRISKGTYCTVSPGWNVKVPDAAPTSLAGMGHVGLVARPRWPSRWSPGTRTGSTR